MKLLGFTGDLRGEKFLSLRFIFRVGGKNKK
jgi:hypothetical protein